jgi:guanosine-3',5'-bis(diphosphate) 3'-pyrophosphohydrolase
MTQFTHTDTDVGSPNALPAAETAFVEEGRLLRAVEGYLSAHDVEHVRQALRYARELVARRAEPRTAIAAPVGAPQGRTEKPKAATPPLGQPWDIAYALGVAETLADAIHIDAISLGAVLLYQAVESRLVALDDVRRQLGDEYGEAVAQTIANIERFDTLQRPGEELRRSARAAQAALSRDGEDHPRERSNKGRERQRQQDAESLRKMFVAMAEDPRVAIFKIADQLRTMRAVRDAADTWRTIRAERAEGDSAADAVPAGVMPPAWSADECSRIAHETRDVYAPLAARLGMARVEGELEDLAFAVLEPDDYAWLSEAVAEYTQERNSYVTRVVAILREEMAKLGVRAEVSGRVKHLYSIYKKVKRSGSDELSSLYDILAFRIIVPTVADCYLALGHVHALWPPKEGRIKDFIATPKPNGYRSLHTTVFCLDSRLAEIQIRTPEMHQMAEYGVAMHWYYKDVGDAASAQAASLKNWVDQVKQWQDELTHPANADRTVEAVKREMLNERIFVFTPAGDVKEVPAGATPLDFAYLIHTDVGNHVSGVRVSSGDGTGRLVRRLVPLDYELRNGDVVEILNRKDAHPTRDWLNVARTKSARDRILRYLKAHERDIDQQIGRDRFDRELKAIGLRKGFDELTEDDLTWLADALDQPDVESLLVAIGGDKLRVSAVVAKLRERLLPAPAAPAAEALPEAPPPVREAATKASVAGIAGMMTRLASCCNPLPGDALMGFITRGRGVVIHRADCPNLLHLLAGEPERGVAVEWPEELTGQQAFRAPIVVVAVDRQGLLMDVTGVIAGQKINMLSVSTTTNAKQHRAMITATLEITRPEQLNSVLTALRQVPSVLTVERKRPKAAEGNLSRH